MPQIRDKRSRNTSGTDNGWPNSRAEKSRHAAKMRRDKESEEITALSQLLPYPEEVTARLDKGSVIRLATSFLRMKKYSKREEDSILEELEDTLPKDEEETSDKELMVPEFNDGNLMMQAWNGFLIFISRKGQIYYISENASKHLGIHQYEMLGKSVLDFIHPDDHKELAKQFMVSVPGQQTFKGYGMEGSKDRPTAMSINFFNQTDEKYVSVSDFIQERSFFLRMRSVMSKKSSSGKGKVVGYRVVNYSGRLKLKSSPNNSGFTVEGLICLCRPIQPLPVVEIRMDGNMFMSRHGMDMSFTFCDPRIITLIGYEPHELIGKTAYQFHNPLDARKVSDCHSNLIVKGSSMSKYYRFLGKAGQWVWMRTKATIIYNTSGVAQYVVAMNYVIGKEEGERMLMLERMQEAIEAPSPCSDGEACHSSDSSPRGPSPEPEIQAQCQPYKAEQVSHYIPKVINEQPILKPPSETIDFSSLMPENSVPPAMPAEVMDVTEEQSRSSIQTEVLSSTLPVTLTKPSVSHMFQTELSKSDSPQSDLESISSSSICSASSPPVQSTESKINEQLDSSVDQGVSSSLSVLSPMFSGSPGSLRDSPSPSAGRNALEDLIESEVFRDDNEQPAPAQNELLTELLKKNPQQLLSMTVTDLSYLESDQSLPQDLADFSLEFYNSLLDQTAQDAVIGNDSELSDLTDMTGNDSIQGLSSAVITELPDDPTPFTSGVPLNPPPRAPVYPSEEVTVKPSTFNQGQYSHPVIPSVSNNVTDGLSKLKIKDAHSTHSPANQSTKSLLKALLTGRGATLGAQGVSSQQVRRMQEVVPNGGGYYPGQGMQGPLGMRGPINNNTLQQDDHDLLVRQRQQRIYLEEKQRQALMMRNHLQEQRMLELQQHQQLQQQLYQHTINQPVNMTPQGLDYPGEPMGSIPQGDYGMQEMGSPQHIMDLRNLSPSGTITNGLQSVNYSSNNYQMNGELYNSLQMNGCSPSISTQLTPPPPMGPVVNGGPQMSPPMGPLIHPNNQIIQNGGGPFIQNGGSPMVQGTMTSESLDGEMCLSASVNGLCNCESGNMWPNGSPVHNQNCAGKYASPPQAGGTFRLPVAPHF